MFFYPTYICTFVQLHHLRDADGNLDPKVSVLTLSAASKPRLNAEEEGEGDSGDYSRQKDGEENSEPVARQVKQRR